MRRDAILKPTCAEKTRYDTQIRRCRLDSDWRNGFLARSSQYSVADQAALSLEAAQWLVEGQKAMLL
jgi:hypothetical protein